VKVMKVVKYRDAAPKAAGRSRQIIICAICAAVFLLIGCGQADHGSGNPTSSESRSAATIASGGEVKEHKWGISEAKQRSVRIGVVLPYCETNESEPQIDRIERRQKPGSLVLTVFVRFPPPKRGACVGLQLHLLHWVKVGTKLDHLDLYDGTTSPPARRRGAQ
jgi:hypothetical protein